MINLPALKAAVAGHSPGPFKDDGNSILDADGVAIADVYSSAANAKLMARDGEAAEIMRALLAWMPPKSSVSVVRAARAFLAGGA